MEEIPSIPFSPSIGLALLDDHPRFRGFEWTDRTYC
jgi:hypothetical protein